MLRYENVGGEGDSFAKKVCLSRDRDGEDFMLHVTIVHAMKKAKNMIIIIVEERFLNVDRYVVFG